jgi:hypothetical protein
MNLKAATNMATARIILDYLESDAPSISHVLELKDSEIKRERFTARWACIRLFKALGGFGTTVYTIVF